MIEIGTRVRVALLIDDGPVPAWRLTMQQEADLIGVEGEVIPLDPGDLSNRDVELADPLVNVALDTGISMAFDRQELEVIE